MNKRKEYITNPARVISFCVFVFGLGVTYATLTHRISKLEEFQKSVNLVKLETTLTAIQKDMEHMRIDINRLLNSK